MQAIEIDARIDDQGEIHIRLPQPRPPGPARVIVLFEAPEAVPAGRPRHEPPPELAWKGARCTATTSRQPSPWRNGRPLPVILLDTHAWVRWLHPEMSRSLPEPLRQWLRSAEDTFAVSVISTLEVAQPVRKGTLTLPLPLPDWFDVALQDADIQCLSVTPKLLHARRCCLTSTRTPRTASSSPPPKRKAPAL